MESPPRWQRRDAARKCRVTSARIRTRAAASGYTLRCAFSVFRTNRTCPAMTPLQEQPIPEDLAAILSRLDVDPAEVRAVEPLAGGISGAGVLRLALERRGAGGAAWHQSRVLNRLLPAHGWLGKLSRDLRIREAQLHRSGLLAKLPAGIATATEAWALVGPEESPTSGALL